MNIYLSVCLFVFV